MPKRANPGTTTGTDPGTDIGISVAAAAATAAGGMPQLDDKSQQILAALGELGEETAGNLAKHTGIAYPTTTPKLRKLDAAGLAESDKAGNGQTVWRLTGTGRALASAEPSDGETAPATAEPVQGMPPSIGSSPDVLDEPADTEQPLPALAEALVDALDGTAGEPHSIALDGSAAAFRTAEAAQPAPVPGATTATADRPDSAPVDADTTQDTEPDVVADTRGLPDPTTVAEAATGGGTSDTEAASAQPAVQADAPRPTRRAPGDLDRSILAILQARPDQVYKVGELAQLINNAERGTGLPKASPGAVVLAAQRLVGRGQAVLAVEKPASFQLLPAAGAAGAAPATVPAPDAAPAG
ncbi:hypothetical protein [Dactylosporangium sp. NPDC048998]|uniref:winged helix-turn-helix domain-containing protein n=1 Tax=Dactylosporangium sp. NPDC048998 TaxID=3363976 RepID=UPI00371F0FAE